ncbi:HEAT repeat domain-containing protein [Streptomyces solincola]|uniref:HEAT repeat domain-containing protein n=1 Tax=Streptomyces solincola TaxID=2100817 RepID=UPI000D1CF3BB|nr:HEAT repeat domain-containing protein [Streptomyces solincola]
MIRPDDDMDTRPLAEGGASARLRAALALGTSPDPRALAALVERCAVEPDFPVREALTWALTRLPAALTVPALVGELGSATAQARSQALHTLSKIGDRRAWPAITRALLTDADDEVARTAWRAAAALAPEDERPALAAVLASQLGRGGRETQRSLSRALVAVGEAAVPVLLHTAASAPDPVVREHALATERLRRDPDSGFDFAIEEARRIVALGGDGRRPAG